MPASHLSENPVWSWPQAALWILFGGLLFSWPALWNGYPLFFFDSIDYIESSFTLSPAIYRTLPYSLFVLATHFGISLWFVVAAQGALSAYLLLELLHACGVPAHPRRTGFIFLAVALGTGLPWFSSQIMPDLFTGAMAASLALLGLANLPPLRRALVAVIGLIAVAAHASHFPTALVIGALLGLLWLGRRWLPLLRVRPALPLVVVLAGILVTPVAHRLATGELYFSHSAPIMALARLVRDGEAQRYLADVCPDASLRLCSVRDQLPTGWSAANEFLWVRGSPFEQVGGWGEWKALGEEGKRIVIGAWRSYPLENLGAALRDWGQQLATFGTGSGLEENIWAVAPIERAVEERFPADKAAMEAGRQFNGTLELGAWDRLHRLVLTAASLAALLLLLAPDRRDTAWALLLLVIVAALVNSAVTAIFSNPDDRYQARLVWLLLPLVLAQLMRAEALAWNPLIWLRSGPASPKPLPEVERTKA